MTGWSAPPRTSPGAWSCLSSTTIDGVMQMRELVDGLPIPAGETVTLMPGGYHVMLMDLKRPLKQGETVTVTLRFEKAGAVTLPLAVSRHATHFEARS